MLCAQFALSAGAAWPVHGWMTAPVLLALYGSMGWAAWLVWSRVDIGLERKRAALRRWGWVLLLSGFWPAALFGAQSPEAALAVMVVLLGALWMTVRAFLQLRRGAALLLGPYGAWLCWAAYMNACYFWSIST